MHSTPRNLQSTNYLSDPFITLIIVAAISLTAISFQEFASDFSYSSFLSLVKSSHASTIQCIEARPGVRDVFGGHTLFVQIKPRRDWKSVFVSNDKINEISKAIRESNLEICFVCSNSVQLFKVLPSLLLLFFALSLIRIGKLQVIGQ